MNESSRPKAPRARNARATRNPAKSIGGRAADPDNARAAESSETGVADAVDSRTDVESRGAERLRQATVAPPLAAGRGEELPNVPEPGDLADRAGQSESTGVVPTPSEALGIGRFNRSESMASEPSEEDIRLRAYHRYLERGGGHGAHFDDWLEAERELKRKDDKERRR